MLQVGSDHLKAKDAFAKAEALAPLQMDFISGYGAYLMDVLGDLPAAKAFLENGVAHYSKWTGELSVA